ncbi:MAG: signal recognition particle protein [Bacteroidota bacterium]|nr:signal recognition particle protein [Bacteroidota bacterium]
MFENLSLKIEKAIKNLKGQGRISEINVAETTKEIRKALVEADVNYKIAKEFTDVVKAKAIGENVLTSISPGQLMIKIVNDELVELLGSTHSDINFNGSPAIFLIAGLQGSGKTTFSGKLAKYIKSKGRNPILVACDVYRPAAINQLKVLGESIDVNVYTEIENKNPLEIAKNALKFAKDHNHNVVIIDTAGRLSIDEQMMNEISNLKLEIKPTETLFVVDSMTGQDAVNTAKTFNDRLNFDGVVLTKLDGDTRGGAALSIKSVVNKPIKFVSNGEKLDALELFYPDRMAGRILGKGDVVSLVERAQSVYNEEETRKLNKKISKNTFDLEDFLAQLQQIKKMGNIKDLMGMIPGVSNKMKDMDVDESAFSKIECIIQSMTPQERKSPEIISASRKNRIAKGSGKTVQEVNKLLDQFTEMKKMMKNMNAMKMGR